MLCMAHSIIWPGLGAGADRVELPPAPACCSIMPKWGHTERTSIRFLPHFLSFRVVLCRGSAPMAKAKSG